MTTLAPAEAERFTPHAGVAARLNLALYRIAISPHRSNAGFVRLGAPAPERSSLPSLELRYLLTAYGSARPADKHSAEHLLEVSLRAMSGACIRKMSFATDLVKKITLRLPARSPLAVGPAPSRPSPAVAARIPESSAPEATFPRWPGVDGQPALHQKKAGAK